MDGDEITVWDIEGEASAAESAEQLIDGSSNPAAISTEGHRRQIEDMMHAALENHEPIVNGHEGHKSLEVVCALYRAAEDGGLICLQLCKWRIWMKNHY